MKRDHAAGARVPDFSAFPDLVVIYLGMQVRTLSGLIRLFSLGPQIDKSGAAGPDGLLHHENYIIYRLFPLHIGMRWYWRDIQSLEAYSKSEPHRAWWKKFIKDAGGSRFWHETYHMRGGMEAIFNNYAEAPGFGQFMPMTPARGSMATRHQNHRQSDISHLPPEITPPD